MEHEYKCTQFVYPAQMGLGCGLRDMGSYNPQAFLLLYEITLNEGRKRSGLVNVCNKDSGVSGNVLDGHFACSFTRIL